MTTRTARGPAGIRKISRVSIATETLAERFAGTDEERRRRILFIFKRAAPHIGIGPHLRETIDLLWSWTQPQDWGDGARPIVWPSNACLSHELGISERQVRKRLRELEGRGLVAAVESPNGRRYGRRDNEGRIVFAYGIDMSPLAVRLPQLEAAAEAAAETRRHRTDLRRRLTIARRAICQILEAAEEASVGTAALWSSIANRAAAIAYPDTDGALDLAVQALEALQVEARQAFETACSGAEATAEANGFQQKKTAQEELSDRHIYLQQHPSRRDTGSQPAEDSHEEGSGSGSGGEISGQRPATNGASADTDRVSPALLAYAVPELDAGKGPEGGRPDWNSIVEGAELLRHHLGISKDAWGRACLTMGREAAAAAVAVIFAKRSDIRSPGGYLRGMVAKAERGELNLAASVYQVRDRRSEEPARPVVSAAAPTGRRLPPPPMP